MSEIIHQVEKIKDSIEVHARNARVYVWWRTKNIVRVTIVADPADSRVFDIKELDIEEVEAWPTQ